MRKSAQLVNALLDDPETFLQNYEPNNGADVLADGTKVKSVHGGRRARFPLAAKRDKTEEDMDALVALSKQPAVDYKSIPDIDNELKYAWYQMTAVEYVPRPDYWSPCVQVGTKHYRWADSKYGRFMICAKTGIKRTQTAAEFYGGD